MDTGARTRLTARVLLFSLAISSAYVAVWILFAPRGFYDSFPTGPGDWVSGLPPYNEHLERDYGAAGLGLATLAALAAVRMDRRLVQAAAISFLVASLPHLAYHLTTTGSYSTADNIGSLVALSLPIVISVWLLATTRRGGGVAGGA